MEENMMDLDSGTGIKKLGSNETGPIVKLNSERKLPFIFDDYFKKSVSEEKIEKFDFIFSRYKKILLVKSKALKPPINLRKEDYKEILKYI